MFIYCWQSYTGAFFIRARTVNPWNFSTFPGLSKEKNQIINHIKKKKKKTDNVNAFELFNIGPFKYNPSLLE